MSEKLIDEHWNLAQPTYIENWPPELRALSMPSEGVGLTPEEAGLLGCSNGEWSEVFAEYHKTRGPERDEIVFEKITGRVDELVRSFPGGAYVRLGSRSPKDSWWGHEHGFRCYDGVTAMRLLLDSSERVHDDLSMALHHTYNPWIWAREWKDIPHWAEFRCFMRDRELVGVSQYFYREPWRAPKPPDCLQPWPAFSSWKDGYKIVLSSLKLRFWPMFQDACPLDDIICDVAALNGDWLLIEINPFFDFTDPCLYSWENGGDFDGGIRVNQG